MHECDLCTQYLLQYKVHVQGRIANFALSSKNELMILISPSIVLLLDHEFNHSRKCLEVQTRKINGVYSIPLINVIQHD